MSTILKIIGFAGIIMVASEIQAIPAQDEGWIGSAAGLLSVLNCDSGRDRTSSTVTVHTPEKHSSGRQTQLLRSIVSVR